MKFSHTPPLQTLRRYLPKNPSLDLACGWERPAAEEGNKGCAAMLYQPVEQRHDPSKEYWKGRKSGGRRQ